MIIKSLRDKAEILNAEVENLKETVVKKQRELAKKMTELAGIEKEIEKAELGEVDFVVADHCLVRYLQRVKDLDTEFIIQEIITPKIKKEYLENGDGKYFNDILNCFVCIQNGVIVTLHYGDYDIRQKVRL